MNTDYDESAFTAALAAACATGSYGWVALFLGAVVIAAAVRIGLIAGAVCGMLALAGVL